MKTSNDGTINNISQTLEIIGSLEDVKELLKFFKERNLAYKTVVASHHVGEELPFAGSESAKPVKRAKKSHDYSTMAPAKDTKVKVTKVSENSFSMPYETRAIQRCIRSHFVETKWDKENKVWTTDKESITKFFGKSSAKTVTVKAEDIEEARNYFASLKH